MLALVWVFRINVMFAEDKGRSDCDSINGNESRLDAKGMNESMSVGCGK